MRTRIVKIGNSRGIRIPKALFAQIGLGNEVEMEVVGDQIILRPVDNPRQGWDAAFRSMAHRGDDLLLDEEQVSASSWDKEEWVW